MADFVSKYRIVADAFQAKAEIKDVDAHLKNMAGSAAVSLGSIAGPAGIAAATITGIAGAAVSVGTALFNLAQQASDYGSAIHDASDKTGLHAETLSAMDVAAKQSGTSLDSITSAIAKYAKSTKGSLDNNTDLEASLAKTIKQIYNAKSGFEQIRLAQQAFGKSGAELLPFIKQFDGDLPGLISKMKDLGVTITDQDARTADDFGDQMVILDSQLKMVGIRIGTDVMPTFMQLATNLSTWLTNNQGEIQYWGSVTNTVLTSAIRGWGLVYDAVKPYADQLFKIARIGLAMGTFGYSEDVFNKINAGALKSQQESSGRVISTASIPDLTSGKGKSAGKTIADQMRKFFEDEGFTVTRTLGSELNKGSLHPLGRAADVSIRGKSQDQITQLIADALAKGYRLFDERVKREGVYQTGPHLHFEQNQNKASGFLGQGFYSVPLSQLQALDQQRLQGKTVYAAQKKQQDEEVKLAQEAAARQVEIDKAQNDAMIADDQRRYQISLDLNDQIGARQFAVQIRDKETAQIESDLNDKKAAWLAAEVDGTKDVQKARDEYTLAYIKSGQAIKNFDDEFIKRIENSLDAASERWQKLGQTVLDFYNDVLLKQSELDKMLKTSGSLMDQIDRNLRPEDPTNLPGLGEGRSKRDPYGLLGHSVLQVGTDKLNDPVYKLQGAFEELDKMGNQALNGLAQGLGSVVENFVLMGSAGEGSLKKLTASLLANVAAQATTQAIMELAYGFAALTVWGAPIYGPASNHFIAAALFGSVAAGTGVAGRAVAGDSFKQQGSGSASGSSTGSLSSSSPSNQNLTPYSRYSSDTYMSGSNDRLAAAIDANTEAYNALNGKISGMSAGDVLTAGSRQRPGFISTQTVKEIQRSPQTGKKLLRTTRVS